MIPNRNAVVAMIVALLVMAGTVQAATLINTCPFVITSPGDYVLSADLICGGGTGIWITSSHVTLKLAGHRITAGAGANMGFSSAISNYSGSGLNGASVADVHILGPGLITNNGEDAFSFGVYLLWSVGVGCCPGSAIMTDSEVSGITVLGSRSAGIEYNGIFFGNTGLTFTKNTLGRNATGISVINLLSSTISENDASGNGVGISIDNGGVCCTPTLMLSHNIVNGNTGDGVNIIPSSPLLIPTVTVQNNVTSGNGGNGINAIAAQISNNKSLANGRFDLFDPNSPGCGAVWSSNTFFTANQSCIR